MKVIRVRVGLRPFRSITVLACALPALVLAGCTTAAPPVASAALDPSRSALVEQTCRDVLGVPKWGQEHDACRDSLADSLRRADAARQLVKAHDDCMKQGLGAQTPALARCVLEGEQGGAVLPASASTPQATAAIPRLEKISFFKMSPTLKHEREEIACAQVGIDPILHEFESCVGEMRQAFWDIENPL